MPYNPGDPFSFSRGGSVTVAASTSNARQPLTNYTVGKSIVVTNYGYAPAFVTFGNSSIVAIAGGAANEGYCIMPMSSQALTPLDPDITHAAAITASGTTNVQFTSGVGQ
jgi:hypothetical protein